MMKRIWCDQNLASFLSVAKSRLGPLLRFSLHPLVKNKMYKCLRVSGYCGLVARKVLCFFVGWSGVASDTISRELAC